MGRKLVSGGVLDIAGSTQKCSWGNVFLTTDPITVAFLFNLRSNGSSSYDVVFGHGTASWYFILNGTAGSERKMALNFQSSGGEKSSGYLTNNLSLNTWYLIVGTHDSAGGANNTTIAAYTASDGALVERVTATNAFSISTTANSLVAGYDSTRTLSVNAQYKNFMIWNRILTTGEQDNVAINTAVSRTSLLLETLCNDAPDSTTLRDSTTAANTYPGTLSGSATLSPNVPTAFLGARSAASNRFVVRDFGTCLNFAGGTDTVLLSSANVLSGQTNFTIVTWIKKSTNAGSNGHTIYCERPTSGNDILKLEILQLSNKLRLTYRDDAATLNQINGVLNVCNGVWNHIGVVKSGTSILFYVNGVVDGAGGTLTATNNFTNANQRVRIGSDQQDGTSAFTGKLDDLQLYTRALNSTEVSSIYRSIQPTSTNFVGWYKFDEGSGASVVDSTGTRANGTITTATYTTDVIRNTRTLIT